VRQRLISAAALVPVVVAAFLLGQPWLTVGIALLAAIGALETARLVRSAGLAADAWPAAAIAGLAVLTPAILAPVTVPGFAWLAGVAPLVAAVVLAALLALRHAEPQVGFRAWLGTAFAAGYPSLLAFSVVLLDAGNTRSVAGPLETLLGTGPAWLLVLVLTVWTLDSAAYVVGRAYGRGAFFNNISPRKTWTGAVGGTAAAALACLLLVWLATGVFTPFALVLGLVIAVAAQAGDLAESMLKRAAGAKDSGTLIPGHGGILDRLDSFIFATPAAVVTLLLGGWL
jgi:phosphatidate cytidylyltransferase